MALPTKLEFIRLPKRNIKSDLTKESHPGREWKTVNGMHPLAIRKGCSCMLTVQKSSDKGMSSVIPLVGKAVEADMAWSPRTSCTKYWDARLFNVIPGLEEMKLFPSHSYFELFSLPTVDSWLLIHFIEALSVPCIKGST